MIYSNREVLVHDRPKWTGPSVIDRVGATDHRQIQHLLDHAVPFIVEGMDADTLTPDGHKHGITTTGHSSECTYVNTFTPALGNSAIDDVVGCIVALIPAGDLFFSGIYNETYSHLDRGVPAINAYTVLEGAKRVMIVPEEHSRLLEFRTFLDSLVPVAEIGRTSRERDRCWEKDGVPYYYEDVLRPGQLLVFHSSLLVHRFRSNGYTRTYSRRYLTPYTPRFDTFSLSPSVIWHLIKFVGRGNGEPVCRHGLESISDA